MFLVLCETADKAAIWAYERLASRGLRPIELVTSDDLAYARWVHRVGADGASVEIALMDGRTIRGPEISGTLNRLLYAPRGHLVLVQPDDRDYVTQELSAFYLSWLHSLRGPMINRAGTHTLCGPIRHISEWMWLAGRAGLPVGRYTQSSDTALQEYSLHARVPGAPHDVQHVLVVGGEAISPRQLDSVVPGCIRLAELARTSLLGVEFAVDGSGEPYFAGATGYPDLTLGGEAFVDLLASSLTDGIGVQ